ncbi:MAG: ABC transporter permease [Nitrospirae bacterium]|nr:MAG: ABC transporter permease [Nitrospirota bacterium]
MQILKLAFRNVLRNKRRSLVSIFVLVIGVMGLGIFSGFMHFSFWGIQANIIHVGMGTPEGTGHFQVFDARHLTADEPKFLEYGLADWQELAKKIETIPEVAYAAPRMDIMGLLGNGEKSEPVIGFAIDPAKEKRLPGVFGSAEPYANLEKMPDGVILGRELARTLNAQKTGYLTLVSTTTDGAMNAIDLQFAGTINTGTPEGDRRFILVNLKSAMGLIQTDRVRKLAVVLKESGGTDRKHSGAEHSRNDYYKADMEKASLALPALLDKEKYTVRSWRQLNSYYDAVTGIYSTIFGFIGVVMAVVVILSIYNTMFMAVIERTREVGTLMAVGTPRRYILLLFLLEGMIIALIGGILGYGGTYVMAGVISDAGLTMPPPPGGTQGYPLIIHTVHGWWISIVLFIMLNTVIACFMPAYRAARMHIVKALYHV